MILMPLTIKNLGRRTLMKIQFATGVHFSPKINRFPLFLFLLAIISCLSSSGVAQSGILDTTFGNRGVRIVGNSSSDSVLQADGKVVLRIGFPAPDTTIRNSIVRLTAAGNIDPTFGTNGVKDFGWTASTIAIQNVPTPNGPEERFVIAGNVAAGRNSSYLRIERYTNAGALDTSFGAGGVTSFNLSDGACTSAVQPFDQKIVIGCAGGTIVRLNANGTADNTFGRSGVSSANIGFTIRELYALPDGRNLVYGDMTQGKGRNIVLARLNPNGSIDSSFGVSGKSVVNLSLTQYATGITFDPVTGYIYGAGEAQIGGTTVQNYDAIILRFNYNGQLDRSFGENNGRTLPLNIANQQDEFTSITLFNGKILVAGEARTASGLENVDYVVARYNLNGTLDTSFGNGGVVLYNFLNNYDHASHVFIQADPDCGGCPKLLVTGGVWTNVADSTAPRYTGILRFIL
jgi:uncharacterized delta-60 repeat protein